MKSPEQPFDALATDHYPNILPSLTSLEKAETISDESVRDVVSQYWESVVKNFTTSGTTANKLIDMASACDQFKANLGDYFMNGSLRDLAKRRYKVLFAVLRKGQSPSTEIVTRLSETNPGLFPNNAVDSITEMFNELNHNLMGTLQTILSDPAMEKIIEEG